MRRAASFWPCLQEPVAAILPQRGRHLYHCPDIQQNECGILGNDRNLLSGVTVVSPKRVPR